MKVVYDYETREIWPGGCVSTNYLNPTIRGLNSVSVPIGNSEQFGASYDLPPSSSGQWFIDSQVYSVSRKKSETKNKQK